MSSDCRLLIGISGSIAVLAMPSYLTAIKQHFPQYKLILTPAAEEFISANTFSLLCADVYYSHRKSDGNYINHVEIACWADLLIILPATANILAHTAHGMADHLLQATILAHPFPCLFFPNMNKLMWQKAAVQRNVAHLLIDGHQIIGPIEEEAYEHASGMVKKNYVMPCVEHVIMLLSNEFQKRRAEAKK